MRLGPLSTETQLAKTREFKNTGVVECGSVVVFGRSPCVCVCVCVSIRERKGGVLACGAGAMVSIRVNKEC